MRQVKLDPSWPTYIAKATWQGTAKRLLIKAKDEPSAKESAWKQIAREMGGDLCLGITIIGTSNQRID